MAANIGPQTLARKNVARRYWPANIGPQILARKFWPANIGPQILARKHWPANFGPQILARKFWPANIGPQKCCLQPTARKIAPPTLSESAATRFQAAKSQAPKNTQN